MADQQVWSAAFQLAVSMGASPEEAADYADDEARIYWAGRQHSRRPISSPATTTTSSRRGPSPPRP